MTASAAVAVPRVGVRHAAIPLVTLAVLSGSAARYVLSPMQELAGSDPGLDDNHVALLQGMSIALPTTLLSIPLGRLVDRANRARVQEDGGLAAIAGDALPVNEVAIAGVHDRRASPPCRPGIILVDGRPGPSSR